MDASSAWQSHRCSSLNQSHHCSSLSHFLTSSPCLLCMLAWSRCCRDRHHKHLSDGLISMCSWLRLLPLLRPLWFKLFRMIGHYCGLELVTFCNIRAESILRCKGAEPHPEECNTSLWWKFLPHKMLASSQLTLHPGIFVSWCIDLSCRNHSISTQSACETNTLFGLPLQKTVPSSWNTLPNLS